MALDQFNLICDCVSLNSELLAIMFANKISHHYRTMRCMDVTEYRNHVYDIFAENLNILIWSLSKV